MECPHCKYKDMDPEDQTAREVEAFWKLALEMDRVVSDGWHLSTRKTPLYACPKCKKAFIQD